MYLWLLFNLESHDRSYSIDLHVDVCGGCDYQEDELWFHYCPGNPQQPLPLMII